MRPRELRLALVCYGGISLAVYMHGITKEIWHLARASERRACGDDALGGSAAAYQAVLDLVGARGGVALRVLPDIIAGASAGGINGIFLAQAIATGASLEPLTQLWLTSADIDALLDPEARGNNPLAQVWAAPLARYFARGRDSGLTDSVSPAALAEVREKLAQFVRARWFSPPFGGAVFSGLLLDAFDAMAAAPKGPRLLPPAQPLDLFVTVTDFYGYRQRLPINTTTDVEETEHRLVVGFHDAGGGLGDPAGLAYAARATASFPGAFPPFMVAELDAVLSARGRTWPERGSFLRRILPRTCTDPERVVLIDGSVLANAPFKPAIDALKDRPARREVDRRFVYIDPIPGGQAIGQVRADNGGTPGFFTTILGAISSIPREQPIHDSLESLALRSARIERLRGVIDQIRPEIEAAIERQFSTTLLFDHPTAARLAVWRGRAQRASVRAAGFAYTGYAHTKLTMTIEAIATLFRRLHGDQDHAMPGYRVALWAEVRARGMAQVARARGATDTPMVSFFRAYDLSYRIRRLRFVLRSIGTEGQAGDGYIALREALYHALAAYLDREGIDFHTSAARAEAGPMLDDLAVRLDLARLDATTDALLADALMHTPKPLRRVVLRDYLGFPYYDIATLPLLGGEGLTEFDPIRVDRIAPDDAQALRQGDARATLKGIEFHNFGAFFSRAYRENDYLWGRLHGADRLIDIVLSTLPEAERPDIDATRALKNTAFRAILDEERDRLTHIPELVESLTREIAG